MVDRTSRRQFVTLQTILWFLLFGCLMDHSNGSKETIRVVCISDTHDMHTKVKIPDGDILIHAGDFTNNGLPADILNFNIWLGKLPHKHKIVIAGNHDITFDTENYATKLKRKFHRGISESFDPETLKKKLTNCIYLEDSSVTIEGYKFYGSPWTPDFGGWAFMLDSEEKLLEKWEMIPDDTDILITHGTPHGILDNAKPQNTNAGSETLAQEVLNRVKPLYHIFGHIHEGYGTLKKDKITFINAALFKAKNRPTNTPIVFDLPIRYNNEL